VVVVEEEVDDGGVGGFDGAAEGGGLVGVDVGAGGEEGGEGGEGPVAGGREGQEGLDFFEENCVEDVGGGVVAEEGGEFGGFGRASGQAGEGVEAAVEGVVVGAAVLEDEVEEGWVGVGHGWVGLVSWGCVGWGHEQTYLWQRAGLAQNYSLPGLVLEEAQPTGHLPV
jgi:hypothetical protein